MKTFLHYMHTLVISLVLICNGVSAKRTILFLYIYSKTYKNCYDYYGF
jgi:hypothetical protein